MTCLANISLNVFKESLCRIELISQADIHLEHREKTRLRNGLADDPSLRVADWPGRQLSSPLRFFSLSILSLCFVDTGVYTMFAEADVSMGYGFVIFCSESNVSQRFLNSNLEPNWPLALDFSFLREKEDFTEQPKVFITEEFKSQSIFAPQGRN